MADKLQQQLKPSTEVICQELDGEMVILDLNQEQYFGLNDVGTRVWKLMADGKSTDDVVAILLAEFDVSEERLRRDVASLIHQLTDAKLLKAAA